jgi:hypothetical protein
LSERSLGRARADLRKPPIHVESQRIPRLRPVEGDPADAVADLIEQVGFKGRSVIHVASDRLEAGDFRCVKSNGYQF